MPILSKILTQIVKFINSGKSYVALQCNLVHGMVNRIYEQYVVMGSLAYRP